MKPCTRNQKPLIWLALGILTEQEAERLRAHLRTCANCRAYWQEVSNIAEKLSDAEFGPELEPSESFHRSVAARIKAERQVSSWDDALILLQKLFRNWRVVIPAVGTACIVIALLMGAHYHRTSPMLPSANPFPIASSETNLAPTLANYQLAANRSFEQLDRLLTSQANQTHQSLPLYTAGSGMGASGE